MNPLTVFHGKHSNGKEKKTGRNTILVISLKRGSINMHHRTSSDPREETGHQRILMRRFWGGEMRDTEIFHGLESLGLIKDHYVTQTF